MGKKKVILGDPRGSAPSSQRELFLKLPIIKFGWMNNLKPYTFCAHNRKKEMRSVGSFLFFISISGSPFLQGAQKRAAWTLVNISMVLLFTHFPRLSSLASAVVTFFPFFLLLPLTVMFWFIHLLRVTWDFCFRNLEYQNDVLKIESFLQSQHVDPGFYILHGE